MHYRIRQIWVFLGACGLLIATGCNNGNQTNADNTTAPIESNGNSLDADVPEFDSVFAYCQARGTLDQPEDDYTGPTLPEIVSNNLQQQLSQAEQLPDDWNTQAIQWRCMANNVYACVPRNGKDCDIKLDFSRAGSRDMQAYCQQNPNKAKIPENVVAQASPYNWLCDGEKAAVKSQRDEADQAGFNGGMWFLIEKPKEPEHTVTE